MSNLNDNVIKEQQEKMWFSSRPKITLYIIGITFFFTVYEFLKGLLLPKLTLWESHAISICVVMILSIFFFLRFRKIIMDQNEAKNKIFEDLILEINQRKQKEEENYYLSYHDQLTGLYNRRFYEEELRRLDTKRNLPMTIIIGDVNGLKLINDSFGHSVGDDLLKKVAQVIKECCREDEIIARIGGDEFVLVLPKVDAENAQNLIKRIKSQMKNEKIENIPISVSFGFETRQNEEESIQEIIKKAEDYMYKKKLFESQSLRGKTISSIISTLHEKNKREEMHSNRVSELCERMGTALGLSEYDITELRTVGLFHDIGKIAIREDILNKAEILTEDEWEEMKRHSEIGYRILSTANEMSEMANYVLAHHERWDGRGYPKGLKEREIPLVSRIIAIADAFDAMTSESCYQNIITNEQAMAVLQKNAGIKFDPELVEIFIQQVIKTGEANQSKS